MNKSPSKTKKLLSELLKSFNTGIKNRYGLEPNSPWFIVTKEGQKMLHDMFEVCPEMDDIVLDSYTLRFEWLNHDQFWIVK